MSPFFQAGIRVNSPTPCRRATRPSLDCSTRFGTHPRQTAKHRSPRAEDANIGWSKRFTVTGLPSVAAPYRNCDKHIERLEYLAVQRP
jgi:hypothetical protein